MDEVKTSWMSRVKDANIYFFCPKANVDIIRRLGYYGRYNVVCGMVIRREVAWDWFECVPLSYVR